jgi:outer membrane protein OmpA-like peptidoglycan-associated protein
MHLLRRAAFCSALIALTANAQTATAPLILDLERLDLDPSALGSLLVSTGKTLNAGEFRLGLAPLYERRPLVAVLDGQDASVIVRNRISTQLFGAFGLTPALELGLQVPLISYQGGENTDALGLTRPTSAGLGTPRLSARVHLLDEDKELVDLAGELSVGVPIGSKSALGGDGNFSFTPRVSAGRQFGDFRASTQVSVLLRRIQNVGADRFGSHFGIDGSIAYAVARFRPELIVRAFVPFTALPTGYEVLASGRYQVTDRLEAFVLAGPGFGHLIGVPSFRAMAGIAFGEIVAPLAPSRCTAGQTHLPEQCPDLDDDGDGILNRDDRCPLEKGLAQYHGCPEPDRDHDGVPDSVDKCPDEPGPKERQGCPVHDRDGDGVEDEMDRCPDQPGPAENHGCPIADRDGDGVPDDVDNCPDEAGPASNHGCPLQQKQMVVITPEQLVIIKDKVHFAVGTARIEQDSHALLKQVAKLINDHPNIPMIRVEGHTDDRGGAKYNLKLSQDRANSVREFLISNGVRRERLEARGYGLTRPLDTNSTKEGRSRNRRVEFNIIKSGEKPGTSQRSSTTGRGAVTQEGKP